MRLVDGVHHLTFLTDAMDRLVAFYERVFEADVTLDMTEEGVRHVFLRVGPAIMGYLDPDSAAHEVILERPGYDDADVLERAAWTTVTLD
jgi:catechol 2,3-dioxygenase-like lactoylglutathione lyase family enzyme